MNKVLALIGPTASGKTSLSIKLATMLDTEIINGDSMQVYKGLDIGTAKITRQEMQGVKHHLLDIIEPVDSFSVAEYQRIVRSRINEILSRKKVPFIVGGTGMYLKSVLYDYDFTNEERSNDLVDLYKDLTNEQLHNKLKEVDAVSASDIHMNNRKRVLRELDIYYSSGKSKSEMLNTQKHELIYDALIIGIDIEREVLYKRINNRVDIMFENNILREIEQLFGREGFLSGGAIKAIGYKEFIPYVNGDASLDEVKELIKKNTRNYAKRQMTWFRNQFDVAWFKADDVEGVFAKVKRWLDEK